MITYSLQLTQAQELAGLTSYFFRREAARLDACGLDLTWTIARELWAAARVAARQGIADGRRAAGVKVRCVRD